MISEYGDNKDIVIFGASYCKYCKLAKKLLADMNHPSWSYIDLENYPPLLEIKLKRASEQNTIPIIYIKISTSEYEFLGGFDKLKTFLNV